MIPTIPPNSANSVAPFVPLGRQAVGDENLNLKASTLKPLETPAESNRSENRRSPDERAGEPGERVRLSRGQADDIEGRGEQRESPQAQERRQSEQRQQEMIREVRQLAARDREVRLHEQAHAAIGGKYASSPRYEYTRGPDGISYAVAGEVSIDTSKIPNDPEATIEKARQIRRAAHAPAEPSSADRQVAAQAARMEAEARAELLQQQLREAREGDTSELEPGSLRSNTDATDTERGENSNKDDPDDKDRIQERARRLSQIQDSNIDINRRLIEIGVNQNPFPAGALFNHTV